jgi:altronate dehydratase large subunit
MYEELKATGKPTEIIHVQELGGVSKAVRVGTDLARNLVMQIAGQQREPADISEVVMAIKCGGSDTTSGMASNCVIGYVADKLVDLGATVVFGETTEFIGGEHLLARRAVNKQVADKIYQIVDEMEARAKSIGCDMRRGQPTPGNIAGGLSSIEEKSLGAIVKSGTRPIQGVLDYPEFITSQKGLWIKDTPGREPEILTGMAATGAQLMCFSTGLGAPQGFPSMPVIKICGNPHTYARMEEDMDVNAGSIITGEKSIDEVADEVFAKLLCVASGEMTKNEAIGYFSAIDIHCLGPVI